MPHQNVSSENELQLLEALDGSPETTQAELAAQVGVAVGTVNWYLKRWSTKGYVKVSPPKALVAEVARLDVQWQAMAAAGRTDFSSMRVEMMNAAA